MTQCLSIWCNKELPLRAGRIFPQTIANSAYVFVCDGIDIHTVFTSLVDVCNLSLINGAEKEGTGEVRVFIDCADERTREMYPLLSASRNISICPFALIVKRNETTSCEKASMPSFQPEFVNLLNQQVQTDFHCISLELDYVVAYCYPEVPTDVDVVKCCVGISSAGQLVIYCESPEVGALLVAGGVLSRLISDCVGSYELYTNSSQVQNISTRNKPFGSSFVSALLPVRSCLIYAAAFEQSGFTHHSPQSRGLDLVTLSPILSRETLGTLHSAVAPLQAGVGADAYAPESAPVSVDVFVAAGQSNMAGRGSMDDLECPEDDSPNTLSFDPLGGWGVASLLMHKNVDVLKNVGVGPANSFASSWLGHQHSLAVNEKRLKVVGIIPVAVGATSIAEWLPDYHLQIPDNICCCRLTGDDSAGTVSPTCSERPCVSCIRRYFSVHGAVQSGSIDDGAPAKTNLYHRGCPNLFSCALRSIYLAFSSATSTGGAGFGALPLECTLRGMLWYQGCNDSGPVERDQATYAAKLKKFFVSFQLSLGIILQLVQWEQTAAVPKEGGGSDGDLSIRQRSHRKFAGDAVDIVARELDPSLCRVVPLTAPLPIVTVAITTTRERLLGLKAIRQIQLDYPRSSDGGVPVAVVDAFGSWLNGDNIHLHSISSIILGKLLCSEMIKLTRENAATDADAANRRPRMLEALNRAFYQNTIFEISVDFERCFAATNRIMSGLSNSEYTAALKANLLLGGADIGARLNADCGGGAEELGDVDAASAYPYPIFASSVGSVSAKAELASTPVAQPKPASSNFVSGEITCMSMCAVLALVLQGIDGARARAMARGSSSRSAPCYDCNFVDLGCGIGIPMASFLLSYRAYLIREAGRLALGGVAADNLEKKQAVRLRVVGVDMMKSKLIEAKCLLTQTLQCIRGKTASIPAFDLDSDILLYQGNFLEHSMAEMWCQGVPRTGEESTVGSATGPLNLVYICATCYDVPTLNGIYLRVSAGLPVGTRVMIMDKKLEFHEETVVSPTITSNSTSFSHFSDLFTSSEELQAYVSVDYFRLINSCQAKVSWGEASVYIYEKIV